MFPPELLINCQSSYLILFNFIYSHCFISLDPGRSPNRKGFGGCIVPVCLLYRSIHVHFLLPFVYYVGFAGALGAWNVLPMPLMACNIERDIGPVDSQSFPFAARYRWLSWQMLILIMEGQAAAPDLSAHIARLRLTTYKCIKIL